MVSVAVRVDRENKVHEMPENLKSALSQNKEAADFFASLTANQKNKFIDFITSAKKQETLQNRLDKVIRMLLQKKKMK